MEAGPGDRREGGADVEPVCDCRERKCVDAPYCKGKCGCERCHNSYQDYGYDEHG